MTHGPMSAIDLPHVCCGGVKRVKSRFTGERVKEKSFPKLNVMMHVKGAIFEFLAVD